MFYKYLFCFLTGIALLLFGCNNDKKQNNYPIIPYPEELIAKPGQFRFTNETKIILSSHSEDGVRLVAKQFEEEFQKASGILLETTIVDNDPQSVDNAVCFVNNEKIVGNESYSLEINKNNVLISASSPVGFFYALQTLKQLLPVAIYGREVAQNTLWVLPCAKINDSPCVSSRGLVLNAEKDSISIKEMKGIINIMAVHKLNILYWYMNNYSENPEVEPGNNDTVRSGYNYIQEYIQEITEYASEQFIRITITDNLSKDTDLVFRLLDYQKQIYSICTRNNIESISKNNDKYMEYLLLMRLAAMGESQWTFPENENWERFFINLKYMRNIYNSTEYEYDKYVFDIIQFCQEDI